MKSEDPNLRHPAIGRWLPWLICGLGAIFYTYEYLLRIAPSVMTTELMQAFQISAEQLGNLAAFYYYAYAPSQFLVGIVMDRYGPRRVLTIACLFCAVGTFLFGNDAANLGLASIGRFLVGFGSAFAFVGVLKLATIWLPPGRFAMMAGLTSALGTIGGMFGGIVMTELVLNLDWRVTTLGSAAVGIVLAVILFLFLRDGYSFAESTGANAQIKLPKIIKSLGKMLVTPQIWINGLIGCLLYLPTAAFAELWGNPYFQAAYGYTPHEAALAMSAIFFGFTVGGPINGWISDRLANRRHPMLLGGLCAAVVIAIVLFVPGIPKYAIYPLLFLFGALYSVQVIVFAVAHELCSARVAGTALAVTNGLVMLGGVVFQPVVGYILDLTWDGTIVDNVNVYSAHNYTLAISVLPIALIVGALLTLFLRETHGELKQ